MTTGGEILDAARSEAERVRQRRRDAQRRRRSNATVRRRQRSYLQDLVTRNIARDRVDADISASPSEQR